MKQFPTVISGVERTCTLRDFEPGDTGAVLDIFNASVRNDFAAFPERELDESVVMRLTSQALDYGFLVAEIAGEAAGFCLLRPMYPFTNMRLVGEVTYFIRPQFRRCGIGGTMLNELTRRAGEKGMKSLLAQISSQNKVSIAFHRKNGFRRSGRIKEAGTKFGKAFDVVFMQKCI